MQNITPVIPASKMFIDPATDEFYAAGQLLTPPAALCDFYQLLATRGGRDFYNGSAARLVADDLHDLGAAVSGADLAAYRVQWTDALVVPLGTESLLHVTPAPSSGPLLAMMVRTLHGFDWRAGDAEDADVLALHRIAEVFKWAFGQRMEMGDPDFVAGMAAVSVQIQSELLACAGFAPEMR